MSAQVRTATARGESGESGVSSSDGQSASHSEWVEKSDCHTEDAGLTGRRRFGIVFLEGPATVLGDEGVDGGPDAGRCGCAWAMRSGSNNLRPGLRSTSSVARAIKRFSCH